MTPTLRESTMRVKERSLSRQEKRKKRRQATERRIEKRREEKKQKKKMQQEKRKMKKLRLSQGERMRIRQERNEERDRCDKMVAEGLAGAGATYEVVEAPTAVN